MHHAMRQQKKKNTEQKLKNKNTIKNTDRQRNNLSVYLERTNTEKKSNKIYTQ